MKRTTRFFRSTLFVLLMLSLGITGYSQTGSIDTSFGTDGIAEFDIHGFHDTGYDIKCLNDGSMYVLASANIALFDATGCIMKLDENGTIDTTWATDGLVTMNYGLDTYPYSFKLLDDGKIAVSGTVYTTDSNSEFFVSKFNPDGTPDTTFGTNGVYISSYSNEEENCKSMLIQPDGKIVLAGNTYLGDFSQLLFMRVNAEGTLDASFGTDGYTEINSSVQDEKINALTLLNDDVIVGVGNAYQSNPWFTDLMIIAKLNPDGSPMTSFGGNGVVIPAVATAQSNINQVVFKDSFLYITGNLDSDLFLAKLDTDAVADASFGTNGMATVNINPVNVGLDLILPGDNKIYVSGTTGIPGLNNRNFLLLRFLSDGNLDTDFNMTGYVTTDIRPYWDEANALDMQADGKIVCTGMDSGYTTSGNNDIAVTRYLNDYSAGIDELPNSAISLYPNPATQKLTVDLSAISSTTMNIKVFDAIGNLIETIEKPANNSILTIDVSNYTNAVYFMSVSTNTQKIINKVFVVKN